MRRTLSTRSLALQTLDRRLDAAAREAAAAIRSADDPAYTAARFLVLLGDSLQSREPQPVRRSA